jgi:hypothetical protein
MRPTGASHERTTRTCAHNVAATAARGASRAKPEAIRAALRVNEQLLKMNPF